MKPFRNMSLKYLLKRWKLRLDLYITLILFEGTKVTSKISIVIAGQLRLSVLNLTHLKGSSDRGAKTLESARAFTCKVIFAKGDSQLYLYHFPQHFSLPSFARARRYQWCARRILLWYFTIENSIICLMEHASTNKKSNNSHTSVRLHGWNSHKHANSTRKSYYPCKNRACFSSDWRIALNNPFTFRRSLTKAHARYDQERAHRTHQTHVAKKASFWRIFSVIPTSFF